MSSSNTLASRSNIRMTLLISISVFIVSQRTSSIQNADKIIVLDDGKIAGKGTHEELLKNCDVYLQIAQSQLSAKELGLDQDVYDENHIAVTDVADKAGSAMGIGTADNAANASGIDTADKAATGEGNDIVKSDKEGM